GKLDCIVLRISGRRRPKPVGFAARDVLAVQAPKVCKPSSGLIFESFNEVTLVFHGTYSHTAWPQFVHSCPQRSRRGRRAEAIHAPRPPGTRNRRPGLATTQGVWARHDQLIRARGGLHFSILNSPRGTCPGPPPGGVTGRGLRSHPSA